MIRVSLELSKRVLRVLSLLSVRHTKRRSILRRRLLFSHYRTRQHARNGSMGRR